MEYTHQHATRAPRTTTPPHTTHHAHATRIHTRNTQHAMRNTKHPTQPLRKQPTHKHEHMSPRFTTSWAHNMYNLPFHFLRVYTIRQIIINEKQNIHIQFQHGIILPSHFHRSIFCHYTYKGTSVNLSLQTNTQHHLTLTPITYPS